MLKECVVCGTEFPYGPGQITCGPKCRDERARAKRKEYKDRVRTENPEKYRAQKREEKRRRMAREREATAGIRAEMAARREREKLELAANKVRHCIICGNHFPAKNNVKTCSDECWLERLRDVRAKPLRKLDPAVRKANKREYYHQYHAQRAAALELINEIKEKGIEALL